jgi:hypothetical protein
MARKQVRNADGSVVLADLTVADLYSLLMFVSADRNRGFNAVSPDKKALVEKKFKEIENELYVRTYGYNPFVAIVINGQKPEDVVDNLDSTVYVSDNKEPITQTFVVAKNEKEAPKEEIKQEGPQTFVVAKNG